MTTQITIQQPDNQQPQNSQPLIREPLQWLFKAIFKDGSEIVQTEEDKSLTRDDGTGSRFTDVLALEDELIAFGLEHVDGKQTAFVDLLSGNFVVNDTPISVHDQNFEPRNHKLRLIYFRETRVDKQIKGTVQDDGSILEEEVGVPRHYVNRYFIGWETTLPGAGGRDNGKTVKVTLAVG